MLLIAINKYAFITLLEFDNLQLFPKNILNSNQLKPKLINIDTLKYNINTLQNFVKPFFKNKN